MKKKTIVVRLNHKAKTVGEALGLTEDRWDMILQKLDEIQEDCSTISQLIEKTIHEFEGNELIAALMILGAIVINVGAELYLEPGNGNYIC